MILIGIKPGTRGTTYLERMVRAGATICCANGSNSRQGFCPHAKTAQR